MNIGFGNAVIKSRIIAIITPTGTSANRVKEEARENNLLIDVSTGRKVRSVIIMDSNHVILSALNTETIINRMHNDSPQED